MRHIIRLGTVIAILLLVAACSSPSATPASTASIGPTASAAPSESASAAPSASAAGGSGGAAVTIKGFAFGPAALTVNAGTTVTWTNEDTTGHTVTFDSGGVTSDTLQNGATFDHTFATAGTFTYHCAIHPSMKGSVTVTQ